MKTNFKGKKNKKALFKMEPSHLELGWVCFWWAAFSNAFLPSPSAFRNSTGSWKVTESEGEWGFRPQDKPWNNLYHQIRKPLSIHTEETTRWATTTDLLAKQFKCCFQGYFSYILCICEWIYTYMNECVCMCVGMPPTHCVLTWQKGQGDSLGSLFIRV